ncbi:MAG TPA: DNA polymerase III subunit delta [Elusimicrobia bacterium]|nr:DNA polymerase III subunit delta [Elusimicrobiota bacterium]HBT62331.1 DNA polymerase III subunit delta [Elusimicrobiota bacterium]
MDHRYADLLKEWKAGRFRPVYYFIGEDASARAEAAAELKSMLNPDSFNLADFPGQSDVQPEIVVSEALTLPVFADRRLVVVRSPRIAADAKTALARYLQEPCPSTTLVLFSDERKVDPRDVLVKAASAVGAVCLFRPLKEGDAVARLQAEAQKSGQRICGEAAEALVAEAGTDWAVLRQELEKASIFAAGAVEIGREHVAACLGYHKSADPFALPRLIQARQLKASLAHLQRISSEGKPDEQAFKALGQMLSAVHKQFRAKRMLKAGQNEAQIFAALRLNSYWDRDYLAILRKLSEARLKRDLKLCLATEAALKSRSWLCAAHEVERLVVDLCSSLGGK